MPSHLVLTLTTPTSTTPYKTYTSHQPLITIGRASRTSLDLLDPSSGGMRNEGTAVMSSRHAQLSWQGHEYALLKDVGSTNGTMVVRKNEEPKQLTKGVVYRLEDGDVLSFGKKITSTKSKVNTDLGPVTFRVNISSQPIPPVTSTPSVSSTRIFKSRWDAAATSTPIRLHDDDDDVEIGGEYRSAPQLRRSSTVTSGIDLAEEIDEDSFSLADAMGDEVEATQRVINNTFKRGYGLAEEDLWSEPADEPILLPDFIRADSVADFEDDDGDEPMFTNPSNNFATRTAHITEVISIEEDEDDSDEEILIVVSEQEQAEKPKTRWVQQPSSDDEEQEEDADGSGDEEEETTVEEPAKPTAVPKTAFIDLSSDRSSSPAEVDDIEGDGESDTHRTKRRRIPKTLLETDDIPSSPLPSDDEDVISVSGLPSPRTRRSRKSNSPTLHWRLPSPISPEQSDMALLSSFRASSPELFAMADVDEAAVPAPSQKKARSWSKFFAKSDSTVESTKDVEVQEEEGFIASHLPSPVGSSNDSDESEEKKMDGEEMDGSDLFAMRKQRERELVERMDELMELAGVTDEEALAREEEEEMDGFDEDEEEEEEEEEDEEFDEDCEGEGEEEQMEQDWFDEMEDIEAFDEAQEDEKGIDAQLDALCPMSPEIVPAAETAKAVDSSNNGEESLFPLRTAQDYSTPHMVRQESPSSVDEPQVQAPSSPTPAPIAFVPASTTIVDNSNNKRLFSETDLDDTVTTPTTPASVDASVNTAVVAPEPVVERKIAPLPRKSLVQRLHLKALSLGFGFGVVATVAGLSAASGALLAMEG